MKNSLRRRRSFISLEKERGRKTKVGISIRLSIYRYINMRLEESMNSYRPFRNDPQHAAMQNICVPTVA
jgi:hypothetical protein